MAFLSLFLTGLSLLTFWLVIPMFVLPPLAYYVGYKAYKGHDGARRPTSLLRRALSAMPMVLAVAAFVFELVVMNTGYQA